MLKFLISIFAVIALGNIFFPHPLPAQTSEPNPSLQAASATQPEPPAPDPKLKKKARVAWAVLAGALFCLVGIIAIITVARALRRFRQQARIGEKPPPTEYFDAWTNYRLKDDDKKAGGS